MANPYGNYDFDTVHTIQLTGHQLLDLRLTASDAITYWQDRVNAEGMSVQWALDAARAQYKFLLSISPTKQFANL